MLKLMVKKILIFYTFLTYGNIAGMLSKTGWFINTVSKHFPDILTYNLEIIRVLQIHQSN